MQGLLEAGWAFGVLLDESVLMCQALILKKLTSYILSVSFDTSNWNHICSIQLAVPRFDTMKKINIIIDADYFFEAL